MRSLCVHAMVRALAVCSQALLIYLKSDDAAALLRACADEAKRSGYARATLVFADRLPNSPGFGVEEARAALLAAGFELDESTWLPKPGLAKHMGVAHSIL